VACCNLYVYNGWCIPSSAPRAVASGIGYDRSYSLSVASRLLGVETRTIERTN